METSSTNTIAGVIGHGLTALGHHIAEHQLPTPHAVLIDEDPLEICVSLRRDTWQAWVDTVTVDEEHDELSDDAILGAYVVTRWKARTDTGLRVTIRTRREVPALQSVTA